MRSRDSLELSMQLSAARGLFLRLRVQGRGTTRAMRHVTRRELRKVIDTSGLIGGCLLKRARNRETNVKNRKQPAQYFSGSRSPSNYVPHYE